MDQILGLRLPLPPWFYPGKETIPLLAMESTSAKKPGGSCKIQFMDPRKVKSHGDAMKGMEGIVHFQLCWAPW